jgi:hypothetical protein
MFQFLKMFKKYNLIDLDGLLMNINNINKFEVSF